MVNKMEYELITKGKARFGNGPYEVQNVRTSAVVVLRPNEKSGIDTMEKGVAVMNLPPSNPPSTDEAISLLVDKYLERTGTDLKNIEAVLVGGVFIEHRAQENGLVVSYGHDIAARCVIESLETYGVTIVPVKTEEKATKTIHVEVNGRVSIDEVIEGLNNVAANMTSGDYKMRFERNECCD